MLKEGCLSEDMLVQRISMLVDRIFEGLQLGKLDLITMLFETEQNYTLYESMINAEFDFTYN
jgi:hypothetical protein